MYKLVDINIQRIVSDISPGLNRQGKPQLRLVYMSFLFQAIPFNSNFNYERFIVGVCY